MLVDGALFICLQLLPPGRIAMEETKLLLCLLVRRHLVLIFATLLGESTGSVVNPFVAIDFDLLRGCIVGWRRRSNNVIDARLTMIFRVSNGIS